MGWQAVEGSFRDPSGFVYTRDGTLYRQVNKSFRQQFDGFLTSGLYDELAGAGLLVPHTQVGLELSATDDAYAVIRPERVNFISYPYEWSFGQLQDAADLTLEMQERPSPVDLPFATVARTTCSSRPGAHSSSTPFSFEPLEEGKPWVAYKQFCEHFLLPLLLMSQRDVRLGMLMRTYPDGIPLDLGSSLLTPPQLAIAECVDPHPPPCPGAEPVFRCFSRLGRQGSQMSRKSLVTLLRTCGMR